MRSAGAAIEAQRKRRTRIWRRLRPSAPRGCDRKGGTPATLGDHTCRRRACSSRCEFAPNPKRGDSHRRKWPHVCLSLIWQLKNQANQRYESNRHDPVALFSLGRREFHAGHHPQADPSRSLSFQHQAAFDGSGRERGTSPTVQSGIDRQPGLSVAKNLPPVGEGEFFPSTGSSNGGRCLSSPSCLNPGGARGASGSKEQ